MAFVVGNLKIGNIWKMQTEVFNLIISHFNRYPKMEIQDVYKLLYQGALGPEHIIDSQESFEARLKKELEEMEPLAGDIPLWENIRPDGELVRINLAPFRAKGGTEQNLATLCFWTASSFNGVRNDLIDAWNTFGRICGDNRIRKFSSENYSTYSSFLEKNNYPAVSHSEIYRNSYHPAYRLVRREFLALATQKEK